MAIYDTMNYVKPDVPFVSMAAWWSILLSAGVVNVATTGIMIHQPLGKSGRQIRIAAERIIRIRERMNKILSENTGQPLEVIARDTERDYFMFADEALKYGLIDEIIEPKKNP